MPPAVAGYLLHTRAMPVTAHGLLPGLAFEALGRTTSRDALSLVASGHVTVGISGARRNAAAAACVDGTLVSFCEQERATRVRGARLEPGALPVEAVTAVLRAADGRSLADVRTFVVAEEGARLPDHIPVTHVEHHRGHAASAFYTSAFQTAAVLVCDRHSDPPLSVWVADESQLARHPWNGSNGRFAAVYSECAQLFGFRPGQEHQVEALARLDRGGESQRLDSVLACKDGSLWAAADWPRIVADWLTDDAGADRIDHRARVASAFQRALGRILLAVLADVRASTGMERLCLAGGLFYNTYFNTLVSQSGLFDEVFVAPSPGNPGVAVGAALDVSWQGHPRAMEPVSPFLGPAFDLEEIKRTLDNCKLAYECLGDGDVISATVDALRKGHLVGWFQGRMEWGSRALGNRSILASPLSPYVLDNLNGYLKQRDRYRTYGLSVPAADAPRHFSGPAASRFMEYEYQVRDRDRFRYVLPGGAVSLRVQTVHDTEACSRRFALLHKAWGEATGTPVLVNTSFNGFSEPIVCSPRDALRVFFGTGLDMLVLDRFVLRK